MRVPRWRIVCCVALVLMTIWAGSATARDYAKWQRYRPLYTRGVTTTAAVLSYSYDPDGGDPGGWATDRVAYVTRRGIRRTATVGHHDQGTEWTTKLLPVTYDPLHPEVVVAAHADVAPDDGSEWWGGLLIALPATVAALGLGAWVVIALRQTREV